MPRQGQWEVEAAGGMWEMESSRRSFLICATNDVLPSPNNCKQWLDEDPSYPSFNTGYTASLGAN